MSEHERIQLFLDGAPHAVVGASTDPNKIGNRVLRAFIQSQRPVYPVNPTANEVEGLPAYPALGSLPESVHGASVITPPTISESIVEQAHEAGIEHLWFQPGAETDKALARANELGMNVVAGGPCILVVLGYRSR